MISENRPRRRLWSCTIREFKGETASKNKILLKIILTQIHNLTPLYYQKLDSKLIVSLIVSLSLLYYNITQNSILRISVSYLLLSLNRKAYFSKYNSERFKILFCQNLTQQDPT